MNPEQLQELEEKANLWDSLSDTLRTIFCGKFERPSNGITTIENTSNASSHIGLLLEESNEMLYKKAADVSYYVDVKTRINGNVELFFSADCGKHGTNEIIDEFEFTTKELLSILKKHDAEMPPM